jgi:hypothetical protein
MLIAIAFTATKDIFPILIENVNHAINMESLAVHNMNMIVSVLNVTLKI